MGIAGGVEHLQWLFTGTFLAMLAAVPAFGWVASRFPRKSFLPLVYLFFIVNLLIFYLLFRSGLTHAWVARAFFIWTSVFNLFIVSVFWSFMADLFNDDQAKRRCCECLGLCWPAGSWSGAVCNCPVRRSALWKVGMDQLPTRQTV